MMETSWVDYELSNVAVSAPVMRVLRRPHDYVLHAAGCTIHLQMIMQFCLRLLVLSCAL
jgi:hypothetical protein